MPITLTPDQVAFLQGPLSMNVGAVGHDGWPCVTRVQGLVVARDRQSLTVLLSASRGQAVLDALAAGSAFTLVASRPATHATLQLKAARVERVAATAAHKLASARSVEALGAELVALGYAERLTDALATILPTDDLVGLRFSPEIVFDQTPGPRAGTVLARA